MLQVTTISVHPEMFGALGHGMPARAQSHDALRLQHLNLRDFTDDPHRTIDDRPFGGGPGMVLKVEPMRRAIAEAKRILGEDTPVYHLSPQGRRLEQQDMQQLSRQASFILVASRFEGVDERLSQDFDDELSIGDYVLSGGELAAMVLLDAVSRLLPGVLGDEASAEHDSFMDGLLDYPAYTRPANVEGQSVPDVLMQGDHQAIATWRQQQALGRTWLRRPDLLQKRGLSPAENNLLQTFIQTQTKEEML